MLVLFVSGLENHFEKLFIATYPADVFRRAVALSRHAFRTNWRVASRDYFLHNHVVAPVVAEVVEVKQRVAFGLQQPVERDAVGVDDLDTILFKFIVRYTVAGAVFLELVEMAVGPPHHDLEDVVKAVQPHSGRNPNAPPNRRTDVLKGDLELIHQRRRRALGWHTTIVDQKRSRR